MQTSSSSRWERTALITGASSGLGLALARALMDRPGTRLVLPARNPQRARDLRNALAGPGTDAVLTPILDLADLASVDSTAASLRQNSGLSLDAVVLNAGVQSSQQMLFTPGGLEQTFAVNHLAHHVLLRSLEPLLAPNATVAWIGSGTHHPELARRFGYTGAHYLHPHALAQGQYPTVARTAQASRDAYATSKGLNILSARHFARLSTPSHPERRFLVFDPGLMPGTGLAREGSAGIRWAWTYVLPLVAAFMAGASTPKRSSAMLAALLLGERAFQSGDYIDFTGERLEPHLPEEELDYAQRLFAFSDEFAADTGGKQPGQRVEANENAGA